MQPSNHAGYRAAVSRKTGFFRVSLRLSFGVFDDFIDDVGCIMHTQPLGKGLKLQQLMASRACAGWLLLDLINNDLQWRFFLCRAG